MNEQLPLLSETPASRKTDPVSSAVAEERITKSGRRAQQQHTALQAVKDHPGCTSKELAGLCHLDRYMLARRLPELMPVHVYRIEGKDGCRWWPK